MTPRRSKAHTAANRRAIEIIKSAHADSGMSRQELSDASGVPDGTLAGLLAGTKPLYAEQLMGLAIALRLDVRMVFEEMEDARQAEVGGSSMEVNTRRSSRVERSPIDLGTDD